MVFSWEPSSSSRRTHALQFDRSTSKKQTHLNEKGPGLITTINDSSKAISLSQLQRKKKKGILRRLLIRSEHLDVNYTPPVHLCGGTPAKTQANSTTPHRKGGDLSIDSLNSPSTILRSIAHAFSRRERGLGEPNKGTTGGAVSLNDIHELVLPWGTAAILVLGFGTNEVEREQGDVSYQTIV